MIQAFITEFQLSKGLRLLKMSKLKITKLHLVLKELHINSIKIFGNYKNILWIQMNFHHLKVSKSAMIKHLKNLFLLTNLNH
jgi:hypothetical protein